MRKSPREQTQGPGTWYMDSENSTPQVDFESGYSVQASNWGTQCGEGGRGGAAECRSRI